VSGHPEPCRSDVGALAAICQAQLLESKGDLEHLENFKEARYLLEQHYSELNDPQRRHLSHLVAFIEMDESNDVDETLLPSDRSKALQELISKFDPVDDVYLLHAGRRRLDDLDAKAVSFRGSRLGQFWSRVVASWKKPDVWSFPVSTALAPALVLFALIYVFWRFWPRRGFLISFEDLTAPSSSSKEQSDRILTQEIQEAFWVPKAEHAFGGMSLKVFAINDHDGSSFATLIPQKTLVVWSDVMQASAPIKLGPVEFNVKQLVALLLGWFQSPTRHALVGSLHEREGQNVITAQRLDRRRRLVSGFSWKVQSESGPHAKTDLFGDLAAQMLVDLRGTALTTSWRSYRSLVQGIAALDRRPPSKDSCNCFCSAREYLWRALEEDPANWMARFYLAIALRRSGANAEAARHLAEVAQLFARAEKRLESRRLHLRLHAWSFIERHLWKYPQCGLVVLYNRAMALSKSHNYEAMDNALRLLSHIVDLCAEGVQNSTQAVQDRDIPDLHEFHSLARRIARADRHQFECVALSAQTVVWAAQAEYLCPETIDSLSQVLSKIAMAETHIRNSAPNGSSAGTNDDSGSLGLALATVLCARGKVQTVLGQIANARESFESAVLAAPNLVDAQLSLAASYLVEHSQSSIRMAEAALNKVLAFDPDCPKAHYWFALLAYSRTPADYNKALDYLTKAQALPEASFLRGEIYANADFSGHDLKASIKAWREGLEDLPQIVSREQVIHLQMLRLIAQEYPKNDELQTVSNQGARRVADNCPWQLKRWGRPDETSNISAPNRGREVETVTT
jgi:tetratricopeptide (TPR) repeat protein